MTSAATGAATVRAPAGADLAPAAHDLDRRAAATVRLLAADAVELAGSGHPGLPMGMATAAWTLWSRFLRHDPSDPEWADRDRFVLSAGHGSALLYALLHLFGYLPAAELARFRQWGSRTPGHPEFGLTPGVETSTGPLGQGLANAVGLALAERMLAARFNAGGHPVVDHRVWVLASDGDLMEGVSHEAASLAGHLGLGRLVVVYDDNGITIDGPAGDACSDDVHRRFRSYGWSTLAVADPEDVAELSAALQAASADTERPTLVSVPSVIGFGAPGLAGTSRAHGAPLGEAELAAAKRRFGWPEQARFHVPDDVAAACARLATAARARRQDWQATFARWAGERPDLAAGWARARNPAGAGADPGLPTFPPGHRMATRKASAEVLAAVSRTRPELVGGSADLAESTGTALPGTGPVRRGDFSGRTVRFGVREHAMGAILNGLALHGGLRPFGSTFLVFSDYLRPALRLAALMRLPVLFVFSHDSVVVGEDGPTHQPVEQLESLRLIPGLAVLRPADANETAACWAVALARRDGPTALVLTRQELPVLPAPPGEAVAEAGAWVVHEPTARPLVTLVGSGSEVSLALQAARLLADQGVPARVVSVPWRERFESLDAARRAAVLAEDLPAVFVEAGVPGGWAGLARPGDRIVGLRRFGASAPGPTVYARLGFTPQRLVGEVEAVLRQRRGAPCRTR